MKLEFCLDVRASEVGAGRDLRREYPGSAHEPGRVGNDDDLEPAGFSLFESMLN